MAVGHVFWPLLGFCFLTVEKFSTLNLCTTCNQESGLLIKPSANFSYSGMCGSICCEKYWLSSTSVKRRFLRRRLSYYSNSLSSYNPVILILSQSNDVQTNPGPVDRTIRCFLQNTRSLKSQAVGAGRPTCKLQDFQEIVYSHNLDVIGITESWLTPDISDGEILPYGYQIFRNDRLLRNGGGTLLAVKNCITACRFDSPITTN